MRHLIPALMGTVALTSSVASADDSPKNLGMVGIKSAWSAYLQAHDDNGELHASNAHRNEEETWFLIEVDPEKKIYALANWRSGKFLSKQGNCAPATAAVLGKTEQWRIESGKQYGVVNAVIFRSMADNTILGTNNPGNDSECGGEVTSKDNWGPGGRLAIPTNNSMWGGWWVVVPADQPSPGKDFWNTVGNAIAGIANKITAADAAALVKLIAQ